MPTQPEGISAEIARQNADEWFSTIVAKDQQTATLVLNMYEYKRLEKAREGVYPFLNCVPLVENEIEVDQTVEVYTDAEELRACGFYIDENGDLYSDGSNPGNLPIPRTKHHPFKLDRIFGYVIRAK